jgi:hypothetical protein
VLTGYASAITPEAARAGRSATLRALDGLTTISSATRTWFSGLYGTDRRMTVHEAVRLVLEAPIGRLSLESKAGFTPWHPESLNRSFELTPRSWSCLAEVFVGDADDAGAIRAVIQYAAESRARGVLRQWSEIARRRPQSGPYRLRALAGAPWDPAIAETTLREVRDAIIISALDGRAENGDRVIGPFRAPQRAC